MEMQARLKRGFLVLLLLSMPAVALSEANSGQARTAASQVRLRLGQAGSQQELDDYNRLHNELDSTIKKALIDEFAVKYPESGLLAYVYQDGVYLGRQANNLEMMAEYGEKSLALWPDNYTLLTELGSVFVQRDRVNQAEEMAVRALDLVNSAERPAYISPAHWSEGKRLLLSSNCITLGYAHLRRAQASGDSRVRENEAKNALVQFETALQFTPNDDFSLYGIGYGFALLNDYPNSVWNLAKCVAVNGSVVASARRFLEEVYRSRHNQTLDGLDQVLAKARAELDLR